MASNEASGEARVEDPVDGRVDTDGVDVAGVDLAGVDLAGVDVAGVHVAGVDVAGVHVAGADVAGVDVDEADFDGADVDEPRPVDHESPDPVWSEQTPPPGRAGTFDAFDASTWNFKPVAEPWYRTGHSGAVLAAVSIAAVALVVSVVLLAFRGTSSGATTPVVGPEASTVPTTATASATVPVEPPPPPLPAPPPPPTASEISRAPVYERSQPPQPTRKPEINVTRSPMSVHPQMPSTRRP